MTTRTFAVDIQKSSGFEFTQKVTADSIESAKREAKRLNPGSRVLFAMQLPENDGDLVARLQEFDA